MLRNNRCHIAAEIVNIQYDHITFMNLTDSERANTLSQPSVKRPGARMHEASCRRMADHVLKAGWNTLSVSGLWAAGAVRYGLTGFFVTMRPG